MRSTLTKYQIRKTVSGWKLLRENQPVFSASTKEACERWIHLCTRYPFGEPTDSDE